MRTIASALAFSGVVAATLTARAELGSQGDAIFGAERLFGIRGERRYEDRPAPTEDREYDQTVISFGLAEYLIPYNVPRLTFDYAVVDKITVGGALGFSSANLSLEGAGSATTTTFLFAPRAGFLHMFGRVAGIWPRAGITYSRSSREDDFRESGLGLNLECYFPIAFTEHFGLLLGLTFDQSLTANHDPIQSVDYPVSYRGFAFQLGLFGWI
jgi:hypothetical protein